MVSGASRISQDGEGKEGDNLIFDIIFCRKLHDNENKLDWRGPRASLDPPNQPISSDVIDGS